MVHTDTVLLVLSQRSENSHYKRWLPVCDDKTQTFSTRKLQTCFWDKSEIMAAWCVKNLSLGSFVVSKEPLRARSLRLPRVALLLVQCKTYVQRYLLRPRKTQSDIRQLVDQEMYFLRHESAKCEDQMDVAENGERKKKTQHLNVFKNISKNRVTHVELLYLTSSKLTAQLAHGNQQPLSSSFCYFFPPVSHWLALRLKANLFRNRFLSIYRRIANDNPFNVSTESETFFFFFLTRWTQNDLN